MADQIPTQPTAGWYTADPLRGSGRGGALVEEDFLRALQISKDAYKSIMSACIRLLEEYADDKNTRVDLRTLWKGHSGSQTKKTMIDDLASDFNPVFVDTARFNPRPSNWATTSRALAQQCFVVANARRSHSLPAAKPRGHQNPTPSVSNLETPGTESVSATPVSLSRQSSQSFPAINQNALVSSSVFTLDNVIIPVVFDGTIQDIAAWTIRPDGQSTETPQYCWDASLEKLKRVIGQLFMREEDVEIHSPNSAGERRLIRSDLQFQVSITRWMGLCTRNGAPPPDYFQIHFTTERAQRGMY